MRGTFPVYNRHEDAMPTVLLAEKTGEAFHSALLPNVVGLQSRKFSDVDALVRHVRDERVRYILVRGATKLKDNDEVKKLFAEVPEFVGIGRAGIGVDNVDLAAATESGVLVQNAPTASVESVAEHGLALILALLKRIPQNTLSHQAGKWDKKETRELNGLRVLMVGGGGRIGSDLASKLDVLGCDLVAFDPGMKDKAAFAFGQESLGMAGKAIDAREAARMKGRMRLMPIFNKKEDLLRLLADADIVSIHAPKANDDGTPVIGEKEIAAMKTGAMLINTARPDTLDYKAAIMAVQEKGLQLGIDVFTKEGEKFMEDPCVLALQGLQEAGHAVAVTHHTAGNSTEAQGRIGAEMAGNLNALFGQGMIQNCVKMPRTQLPKKEGGVRVVTVNKNMRGANRRLAGALESAGLNANPASFAKGPTMPEMTQHRLDMLAYDVDVNGSAPADVAAEVRKALDRMWRDDSKTRDLFRKALIL